MILIKGHIQLRRYLAGFGAPMKSITFCPVLWIFAMCPLFPAHKLPEGRSYRPPQWSVCAVCIALA